MEPAVVCVCCGYRTLSGSPGSHETCVVCGWEGGLPGAEFIAAVRAIAGAAPAADPDNLSGISIDFDHYLWRCPSIREVAVSSSADPARPLTARCLAESSASPRRVAEEITQAWQRDLRYAYWETHSVRITSTSVELHAATQVDKDGYFITAVILVGWSKPADT
ncbi:CPCC family cysteine-rich protein [Actinoplanes solisilvae]|uniref:CPCC family cysteine-rich protein n=1 Tax=Actinoplanes solisilvae TaxID=2486853 RepID=UPI0013E37270|nr:CPCC family cysteine-rich protein [Actinoplanes solisilvae]